MKTKRNGMPDLRYWIPGTAAFLFLGVGCVGAIGSGQQQGHEHETHNHHAGGSSATAELVALSGSQVKGTLHLMQHDNSNVLIKGTVEGLTPGKHGFHIHVNGNCDSADGMSAGGHFAPMGGRHNSPAEQDRHLGDLGNIEADRNGVARVNVDVPGVSLALIGLNSIVNRSLVIHAKEDDYSDPAGNSGARVACAVIEQDNDMRM